MNRRHNPRKKKSSHQRFINSPSAKVPKKNYFPFSGIFQENQRRKLRRNKKGGKSKGCTHMGI